MKAMESLLKVIARKPPREVFNARVGNRTVRAVEQEFILDAALNRRSADVRLEGGRAAIKRLPAGARSLHFITVKAASDKYRLAVRTVQQLCRDRKVVCRRQGMAENSPWLVAEESIKAYCDAQRA